MGELEHVLCNDRSTVIETLVLRAQAVSKCQPLDHLKGTLITLIQEEASGVSLGCTRTGPYQLGEQMG